MNFLSLLEVTSHWDLNLLLLTAADRKLGILNDQKVKFAHRGSSGRYASPCNQDKQLGPGTSRGLRSWYRVYTVSAGEWFHVPGSQVPWVEPLNLRARLRYLHEQSHLKLRQQVLPRLHWRCRGVAKFPQRLDLWRRLTSYPWFEPDKQRGKWQNPSCSRRFGESKRKDRGADECCIRSGQFQIDRNLEELW